jgi:hypothetical protein
MGMGGSTGKGTTPRGQMRCKYIAICGIESAIETLKAKGNPAYKDYKQYYQMICLDNGRGCRGINWIKENIKKLELEAAKA